MQGEVIDDYIRQQKEMYNLAVGKGYDEVARKHKYAWKLLEGLKRELIG